MYYPGAPSWPAPLFAIEDVRDGFPVGCSEADRTAHAWLGTMLLSWLLWVIPEDKLLLRTCVCRHVVLCFAVQHAMCCDQRTAGRPVLLVGVVLSSAESCAIGNS